MNVSTLTLAAVAAALVITLVLAAWLTPSHWWRQLNLRALAIVGAGTWAMASLMLWLAQSPAPALAAPPALAASAEAGRSYRVHDALNLRSATGTGSTRITVVPAGTLVTATGARDGDWWHVRAIVNGAQVEGWSSSLWLRRTNEGAAR